MPAHRVGFQLSGVDEWGRTGGADEDSSKPCGTNNKGEQS